MTISSLQFGLNDSDLKLLKDVVILPLKEAGAQVWIYDSRARGDYKPFSDVDILVEGDTENLNSILSQVKEDIEESKFPYKVDVVLVDDLAKSYLQNVLADRKAII